MEPGVQNFKVWCVRLGFDFDETKTKKALKAAGFEGSVLVGPMTLIYRRLLDKRGHSGSIEEKRQLATVMGKAHASIARKEILDIDEALAKASVSTEGPLELLNLPSLREIIEFAFRARQTAIANEPLVNKVLRKKSP